MNRDENIELDTTDYEFAMAMMVDMGGREWWSIPKVLAQWVATIRAHAKEEDIE
jgi:hypothetical protein